MNTYELIDKAADLIEHTGWTQHSNARDKDGEHTSAWPDTEAEDKEPVCFCASGALLRAYQEKFVETRGEVYRNAMVALADATPDKSIILYNDVDGRTKEEVVNLMRLVANNLRTLNQGTTTCTPTNSPAHSASPMATATASQRLRTALRHTHWPAL